MNKELLEYVAKLSASDKKSLSEKALKTAEEVGELAKVVLPYDGAASTTHRFVTSDRILTEVADVILCALSVAYDLGFSDEAITARMLEKAKYWEELQIRERGVTYPLPYEIHVTISPKDDGYGINLEQFKADCALIGVKPLLIDMHNHAGETVMLDVQTSSVHMGDNRSAHQTAENITDDLRGYGYNVVRTKIETVPWHPAAPSDKHANPVMPKDCYFEAHFNIVVQNGKLPILQATSRYLDIHISRNAFKRISDDEVIMMATLRRYNGTSEKFAKECTKVAEHLTECGFSVPKTITEFSIYDTRVSHDATWLVG